MSAAVGAARRRAGGFLHAPTAGVLAAGLAGAALLVHGLWIPAKAALAQLLLERAWRRALAGEARPRPWPWADTWPVARLVLPAAEPGGEPVDLVVLAGASGRTLAFAPGHLDGSARPGEDGNVVIAGHRDTHFRALARLATNDEILLEIPAVSGESGGPAAMAGAATEAAVAGETVATVDTGSSGLVLRRRYRVAASRVADKSRTDLLGETVFPTLTLVTCWPFDAVVPGGPLRYVVSARAVDGPPSPPGSAPANPPRFSSAVAATTGSGRGGALFGRDTARPARLPSSPDAQDPLPLHRQLLPQPDGGGVGAGAQGG